MTELIGKALIFIGFAEPRELGILLVAVAFIYIPVAYYEVSQALCFLRDKKNGSYT